MTQKANMPPDADSAAWAKHENVLAAKILLIVLVALAGWGVSIATWGIPGLYLPALALVPVMYLILILISRG